MMHAVANDVIYVHEPFVVCRDSVKNETFKLNADVSQIIEQWSIINAFSAYAQRHELSEISARKDEAIAKLSELCKRYAAEFAQLGRDKVAGQYLGLSLLLNGSFDGLCCQPNSDGIDTAISRIEELAREIQPKKLPRASLRQISYRPPKDAIQLTVASAL